MVSSFFKVAGSHLSIFIYEFLYVFFPLNTFKHGKLAWILPFGLLIIVLFLKKSFLELRF